jgi:hypothetical protein
MHGGFLISSWDIYWSLHKAPWTSHCMFIVSMLNQWSQQKAMEKISNTEYSFIHSSTALQSFAGLWPLLQFRNHFYTDGRTPWETDQPVTRSLPTHRINAHTDIYTLSGIWTHNPRVRASEDISCLRPCSHCDRQYRVCLYVLQHHGNTSICTDIGDSLVLAQKSLPE